MSEYPHDREWEIPPEERDGAASSTSSSPSMGSPSESESSSRPGVLARIFGPILGFVYLCTIILVVFGVIFVAMTLASANGTPISGGYGWLLILVGAYVINRIVA